MNRFLQTDKPLYTILSRIADLMILNILWLLCCLPILTIGPSTTALYYVTLKISERRSPYIVKSFFHSFRENLKQGVLFTLFFLILFPLLYFDVQIALSLSGFPGQLLLGLFLFLAFAVLVTLIYVFPVLARFHGTFPGILKIALSLGIRHLPFSLLLLVLDSVPWLLLFFFPYFFLQTLPIWLLIGFAAIAWINSLYIARIFVPLLPEENPESDPTALDSDEK